MDGNILGRWINVEWYPIHKLCYVMRRAWLIIRMRQQWHLCFHMLQDFINSFSCQQALISVHFTIPTSWYSHTHDKINCNNPISWHTPQNIELMRGTEACTNSSVWDPYENVAEKLCKGPSMLPYIMRLTHWDRDKMDVISQTPFKYIFLNGKCLITIQISLKFV